MYIFTATHKLIIHDLEFSECVDKFSITAALLHYISKVLNIIIFYSVNIIFYF